jgi:S1-C subfamily serine protease
MPGAAVAPDPPAPAGVPRVIMAMPNVRVRTPAPVKIGVGDGSSTAIAGASLSEIRDEALGQIFGVASGLLVTEVFSDPAQGSGLKGGDVVVGADGQDIKRLAQLRRIIAAHSDDRTVELEVVRQKRTRMVTLRW